MHLVGFTIEIYYDSGSYKGQIRWTSETCRVLFQNKINLRYCASGWFYYRNTNSECYVLTTKTTRKPLFDPHRNRMEAQRGVGLVQVGVDPL